MKVKFTSHFYKFVNVFALVILATNFSTTTLSATSNIIKSPINNNGCPATLDFKLKSLASTDAVHLCEAYKGKVILIVNTASKCGFTDQFGDLEKLYNKYKDKGFVVLGFPSNDFGNQDPDSEKKSPVFAA